MYFLPKLPSIDPLNIPLCAIKYEYSVFIFIYVYYIIYAHNNITDYNLNPYDSIL